MLIAQDVFFLSVNERQSLIMNEIPDYDNIVDDSTRCSAIAGVINSFIEDYFELRINADLARIAGTVLNADQLRTAINNEIDQFRSTAIQRLHGAMASREEVLETSRNIYEMCGAVRLASANRITRELSTTMGLLWERLALLSPYAIDPEVEFNLRITGIDLIAKNFQTSLIEYQQLKTQRNTLTGSQQTRSVSELIIHQNPVFCACFSNNNWTFRHDLIPRVAGREFWARIGINYDIFFEEVQDFILELEREFSTLLGET